MALREDRRASEIAHVMASIDRAPDGDRLVIADLDADGRWLSVPVPHAVVLDEHR